MGKRAVLAGATGLVGARCLSALLAADEIEQVFAISRRPLAITHPKLEVILTQFTEPVVLPPIPGGAFLCALGTTIRKAGSQEAFRRVDCEIPFELADAALRAGAASAAIVSSVGADADSPNFYLRVKGEMEEGIRGLGYQSLDLFRPSFLIGDREEDRPGERIAVPIAKALGGLLVGSLSRYRAVPAEDVAKAMVRAAILATPGERLYYWRQIQKLAATAAA
jgi:uncharacterized protein YbjT (DUF2867 family)